MQSFLSLFVCPAYMAKHGECSPKYLGHTKHLWPHVNLGHTRPHHMRAAGATKHRKCPLEEL